MHLNAILFNDNLVLPKQPGIIQSLPNFLQYFTMCPYDKSTLANKANCPFLEQQGCILLSPISSY